MSDEFASKLALSKTVRVEEMRSGEEISAMVRLHEVGWGVKRIAQECGCARNTVRRYLREGGNEDVGVLPKLILAVVAVAFARRVLDRWSRDTEALSVDALRPTRRTRARRHGMVSAGFPPHLLDIVWRPAITGGIGEGCQ